MREKTLKLLNYLKEYVKLNTKRILLVEDYKASGLLLWFSDIPQGSGCYTPAWGNNDNEGIWLEVHKQQIPEMPELPERLIPWVDMEQLLNSDGSPPKLREEAFLPRKTFSKDSKVEYENDSPILESQLLANHPEIERTWNKYIEKWKPWAIEYSLRTRIQAIYSELFTVYQQFRRLGEAYELIVGLGLLAWETPKGKRIRRHVFAAQAEIQFDARRGVISVHCPPPPDGAKPPSCIKSGEFPDENC